jgi:hypothetical protein
MTKTNKIRIGIDLDHVIRDINRQIVKYYQRDIDDNIDIDDVDYKDDVIKTVCHFGSKAEIIKFLYEDYPLEVFGHAGQVSRNLSRDLNMWLYDLTNQEKYNVDVFFFSTKEDSLTIQSSYFFLAKIGSRVRKVYFPCTMSELATYGDVFITADSDLASSLKKDGKSVIFVKMNYNQIGENYADWVIDGFREFLDEEKKLDKINNILKNKKKQCQEQNKEKSFWTSMLSWISSLIPKRKGTRI